MLEQIDHISIATDLWSSSSVKAYITVTGHFIHDFQFYSIVLATEEVKDAHTSDNISKAIHTVLEKFNVTTKVVTIVKQTMQAV